MSSPLPQDCRDVEALKRALAGVDRAKYVFFWGHRPPRDGSVSPSCFSQWFAAPFVVDGDRYATAEHFMMAAKARLFSDTAAESRIMAAASPGAAKAIGREVQGFAEEVWVEHRFDVAVEGNLAKFSQNARLGEFLRGTAQRVLVEASPVDRIWGVGLEADDPRVSEPRQWPGLNLLGFALMEVRARMSQSAETYTRGARP